jgi:ADP-heptose:LPS heptosyltransferase
LHKFIYDVAIPRSAYRFEAGTFLEQLCPLGIDYDWPPAFDMKISPARRDRPYIVYFPTASIPEKTWPADNFTILIRNTAAEYPDFDHIILSGIAEWEISAAANIMTSLSEIENIILMQAGPDDQALIQGADLLVSNDTGIRHLGIALNTTTVCIFSNTPPYRYWPRYGHHQVVYNQDGSMPDWKPVGLAINKAMAEKLG